MTEEAASSQPGDMVASAQAEPPWPPLPTRVPSADLTVGPVRALDDVALLARVREGLGRLG
jgi:hypothetical protein